MEQTQVTRCSEPSRLGESYMQWAKRRMEKIVTRLLVTAMLAIIAIGVLVVVATIFQFRK
jgi:uncharacterized membrane protein